MTEDVELAHQYYWYAFDVETSGILPEYSLQPWRFKQRKAWMTTAAFSFYALDGTIIDKGKIYPKPADLRAFLEMVLKFNGSVVGWNVTFDIAWLLAYGLGDLVHKVKWIDAMRMWKHLDLTSSFATADHTYTLKGERGAAGVFLPDSVGREEDVDYHSRDPEELKKLLAYNKDDTRDTLRVAEMIWEKLDAKRRAAFLIECECLPMVAAANLEGMQVDRKATVALNRKLAETATTLAAALAPHGITEKVIASPKQLAAVIFDQWGLPQIQARSTKKDVLTELVVVDERAAQLMQYREALGLKAKFIGAIVKSVEYNEDRITRPQANVFGTYTSRLTYNSTMGRKGTKGERHVGFALHQMKRDKAFRSLIVAPEGYDIVEFDAAGQEFRWMAIQSGDETMLMLCQPGEDAHSFMGSRIAALDYQALLARIKACTDDAANKIRQGGKVGNLSLQYRTTPKTFRLRARTDHGMVISEAESRRICQTYLRSYPGVPQFWNRQIAFGRSRGYVETLAGRRVQLRGNWYGEQQWALESTTINYPIQGTGGEQKYLALAVVKDRLPEYNARFAWDLHDGVYFYVPKDKSLKFAHEMRSLLDNLPYKKAWGFTSPIPLPWDAKVGSSWGGLKELA